MIRVAPTDDIAACLALRRRVFVAEQGVPEAEEADGRDGDALHLLAARGGVPVGCARILVEGDTGRIGRVCVLAEARGAGIGTALVETAVALLRTIPGLRRAELGAQTRAIGFYERLGFAAHGPEYRNAGIPHRDMVRLLSP